MNDGIFDAEDLRQLRERGIEREAALAQLERIGNKRIFTRLERACSVGDGIIRLDAGAREALSKLYLEAARKGRAMQFVPASGAATRMFKALISIRSRPDPPGREALAREAREGSAVAGEFLNWLDGLENFPFAVPLRTALERRGLDMEVLKASGDYGPIVDSLLDPEGLGYAAMPKAFLPFHLYPEGGRSALEEHLSEAVGLVQDEEGICRLHFTVSPEHKEEFKTALERLRQRPSWNRIRFRIGVSIQDPSTDTLAADMEGKPFRDRNGRLVFRPGGHGALLGNLSRSDGDIVFIKNIDNIVPDSRRSGILSWRMALGGCLVAAQRNVFHHLEELRSGADESSIEEAAAFVENRLGTLLPDRIRKRPRDPGETGAKRDYLITVLDRPIRVCGMVENRGEPGGGPFWVRRQDGSLRLQIVEQPQIDAQSSEQAAIASASAYFNPTDLVCGVRNSRGFPFLLEKFADPDSGFVAVKSQDGRELQALEWPGLWNGSMADWNTVFVEIPADNFNPVKTVTDLLRPVRLPG